MTVSEMAPVVSGSPHTTCSPLFVEFVVAFVDSKVACIVGVLVGSLVGSPEGAKQSGYGASEPGDPVNIFSVPQVGNTSQQRDWLNTDALLNM